MDLTMLERVGDRWGKMEGYCSTDQSPQWAVVPMEGKEEGYVVVWQHVLGVACVLCAVQNETVVV
jgi:hypothetical protein